MHEAHKTAGTPPTTREAIFGLKDVSVRYGGNLAVADVSVDIFKNHITALIGPSGCGKSTLIRCLNRMNDLIPAAIVEGEIIYHGQNLYDPQIDPVEVRKRIGMVFQKPNPFPKSIYDNIAFGPRILGMKGDMDEIVEKALRGAALWDEVKDRLSDNAFGMSGGQQQRLCIARCMAVEPDVILMDEPCSALDPISTGKIEDLMMELKEKYSIVIVTHNMQQAARVSDMTAFLIVELDSDREEPLGPGHRVRRHREDLHQPGRQAHRGLRLGQGRLTRASGMPEEARLHYQEELQALEERALDGLDLVVQALDRAIEAVQHQDTELAQLIVAEDDVLDGRYLEIHQRLLTMIATQAPVATDLRLISALLHVMKNMERMGDQCVNIAKMVPIVGHEPPADERMLKNIFTMGKQVRSLVTQVKRAFADRDVDLARDLVRQDDVVDNLNKEMLPDRDRDRRRPRHAASGR